MAAMEAQISIMAPLYHRKRAKKAKPARVPAPMPDPRSTLCPLGESVRRTLLALQELLAETADLPSLWALQTDIAEAVLHEFKAHEQRTWKNGIEHGKWLAEKRVLEAEGNAATISALQSQLFQLQTDHAIANNKLRVMKELLLTRKMVLPSA